MGCSPTYIGGHGPDVSMPSIPGLAFPTNPFAGLIVGQVTTTMGYVVGLANSAVETTNALINQLGNIAMPSVDTTMPNMDIDDIPYRNIDIGAFVITDPTPIPDPYFPFDYSEDYYQSPLQDAIQAKLMDDIINGGTGLNADVEAAIMARETERDNLLLQETTDKVSNDWSKRRFTLPNGVLAANIRRVYTEWENARLDKSRKIAEDSEKIAIENTRWANDSGIKLEEVKMGYKSNYWRRKLDGATAVVNAGVQIFDSFVKKFVSHYEGMKAKAQAYTAQASMIAAVVGIDVEILKAKVLLAQARGDIAIKVMDVEIRLAEAVSKTATDIASAAAQVASHIAAGALSAIHASASMSENSSHSESSSYGISIGYSQSNNYSLTGSSNVSYEARMSAANDTSCVDYYSHEEE